MLVWRHFFSVVLLCVIVPQTHFNHGILVGVGAWSVEGHERIARISEPLLGGKRRDQLRTMMHGGLVDLSDWEQKMSKHFPETEKLHWHRQAVAWNCRERLGDASGSFRCDGSSAEPNSIFCAMAYFFDSYSRHQKLLPFPEPMMPLNTPDNLEPLHKVDAQLQQPEHNLRWLAILLGDMHQPLHWMQNYNFGKQITVFYRHARYDLLKFWEEFISRNLSSQHGEWSRVLPSKGTVHKQYTENSPKWKGIFPPDLFANWAQEMGKHVCTEVILPLTENFGDGRREVPSEVQLTEGTVSKWLVLARELTTLAAQRMAFLMNGIVAHRKRVKRSVSVGHSSSVATLHSQTRVPRVLASSTPADRRSSTAQALLRSTSPLLARQPRASMLSSTRKGIPAEHVPERKALDATTQPSSTAPTEQNTSKLAHRAGGRQGPSASQAGGTPVLMRRAAFLVDADRVGQSDDEVELSTPLQFVVLGVSILMVLTIAVIILDRSSKKQHRPLSKQISAQACKPSDYTSGPLRL